MAGTKGLNTDTTRVIGSTPLSEFYDNDINDRQNW